MGTAINGHADGPTIPASADTLLRFQVGKKAGDPEREDAPVYLLAGPSDKMQRAYQAALKTRGLSYPSDDDVNAEIRVWLDDMRHAHTLNPEHGIDEATFTRRMDDMERFQDLQPILQAEALKEATEALERAVEAKPNADTETAAAEPAPVRKPKRLPRDQQLIVDRYAQLRRLATANCPGVQELETGRRNFIAGYHAARVRVVLMGGERLDHDVVRKGTEVDDATMAHLDDDTCEAIATFWNAQSLVSAIQKKTSVSPPPSDATPTTTRATSGAARSRAATGRSRATMNGTTAPTSTPAG